jgi:flagellar biosynthesis/type III secretory pathway protein FliH
MSSPRQSRPEPLRAVEWTPDELELDAAPFGGAPAASAPAQAPQPDLTELVHQQAIDEAFSQGFDAGKDAGAAAERQRLETSLTSVITLLVELREREARWAERLEENVCALAVAVGRQLFDAELQASPANVAKLVRRALTEFPIDQPVTIRVNPSDLASITASAVADGGQVTLGRAEAQWIPDPRVAPGGCMIEGRDRIVDGRVDTALERIYRRLTGAGA